MADPVLEVTDLALRRGERRLFDGLEFSLRGGQLAVVTGPNGAGKTTLLRALAGLHIPASGRALSFGAPAADLTETQRRNVLFQGHLDGLKLDLTVNENLRFWHTMDESQENVDTAIDQVGLSNCRTRLVRHLSAGQRRRAALARMKMHRGRLCLLDEPLTNLDQDGRQLVQGWIDAKLAAGCAAVVATHTAIEATGGGRVEIEL